MGWSFGEGRTVKTVRGRYNKRSLKKGEGPRGVGGGGTVKTVRRRYKEGRLKKRGPKVFELKKKETIKS